MPQELFIIERIKEKIKHIGEYGLHVLTCVMSVGLKEFDGLFHFQVTVF